MELGKHLIVLPTSRAIRERVSAHKHQDGFLAHFMSIGEFMARLVHVKGAHQIDEDRRNLLLLEAAKFERFETLQIERNFFAFIQNSNYIFRFLEELSGEMVAIETLQSRDTYGEYEEHLHVLHELYRRFDAITEREGVIDSIYLPKRYELNRDFIASYESIHLESIGYLTAFEMQLLHETSAFCPLSIRFDATPYNTKMRRKFEAEGFKVNECGTTLLDMRTKTTTFEHEAPRAPKLTCKGFSQRLLQVAFVKEQLYRMVRSGIAPEKIAVVVPDEAFAQSLKRFDGEHNLNLAMGTALRESLLVQRLEAFSTYLDDATVQNAARINRLGGEGYEAFVTLYTKSYEHEAFLAFIDTLLAEEPERVKTAINEALFHFGAIRTVLETLSMRQVFHLFLQRLNAIHLDDVGGGKITVLGLLETRAIAYDGVVIVDFNEGFVPRISDKDLFLNTQIREHSGLPTSSERQDLQKHYYYQLIHGAKTVAISYVNTHETLPSRFLAQMQIEGRMCDNEAAYAQLLFTKHALHVKDDTPIIEAFDFRSMPLSATALKRYLTCKRQFYYRYLQKIVSHRIAKDLPEEWEIGLKLHDALRSVYETEASFESVERLRARVENALDALNEHNPLAQYQLRLWREKLASFYANEIARFASGSSVLACEKALTCKHNDLTLSGRIDRIDTTQEGLEVLDYKSGSFTLYGPKQIEEATDFQLEFYYLLASTLGRVKGCGYYDLNSGTIANETLLEAKLEKLGEHLDALPRGETVNFERCDDLKACTWCDYATMCGRV